NRSLCVPHSQIQGILEITHDEKHHFGRERMLYDPRGLSIDQKTYLVKEYIAHYP
ncbi:hypothetical protein QBC43DRAFT_190294, partial [Cladorrhinum sp. PSN259]